LYFVGWDEILRAIGPIALSLSLKALSRLQIPKIFRSKMIQCGGRDGADLRLTSGHQLIDDPGDTAGKSSAIARHGGLTPLLQLLRNDATPRLPWIYGSAPQL
jgi:hypothetical protein